MKSKAEIWREVHGARTACPRCGKSMTRRTLRWKHLRKDGKLPRRQLDPEQAEQRQLELERLILVRFDERLQQRNGGQAAADG